MALAIPPEIQPFLKVMGKHSGLARARKYNKEQLSAWGKLGGRPRKASPVRARLEAILFARSGRKTPALHRRRKTPWN